MATVDGSGKKYQGLSKSWTEFKKKSTYAKIQGA